MHILERAYRSVVATAKAFRMSWSSRSSWSWVSLGRTRYDYAANTNPANNAAVMATVLWVCRAFPESPLRVSRRDAKNNPVPRPDHPLVGLLARPNPFYSGVLLWMATLADWLLTGNAYWAKIRSGAGRPVEIWWLPSRYVRPKYPDDGSVFISHYEYRPDSTKAAVRIEVADVVHFRYGIDPDNPRLGLSPLASLAREVFTDDEAANFSATILKNLGVPGVVISPDSDLGATREQAEEVKADFRAKFGGDNRGDALVMLGKTKVQVLSFSPEQMNLKDLRRLPEERISAIFGIPAIVVGLGAGLDRSTFANYAEAREAAYESNVIPTQRLFAAEIQSQLLGDFGDTARTFVDFDLSQVRVLQPDLDALWKRLDVGVQGGWVMLNEAREKVGLEPLPQGDVLYVKMTNTSTAPDALIPPEPSPEEEPPALEEPAPLRALPPPKGRKARAGPRRVGDGLVRLRTRHQAPLQRALVAFLSNERELAAGRAEKGRKQHADDVSEATLRRLLESWYKRVLGGVHTLVEDGLGLSFELDDPSVRRFLERAGANIAGIQETTREAVAAALQDGHAAGEGVEALARRIRDLPAFGAARARTIARTELGQAANLAAADRYAASQVVVGVEVLDGDQDAVCADWAGRKVPIAEASSIPSLGHPNCLVGSSMVLAPNLAAAFARWFDGEVVVVETAEHDLLTCTPNHPVLTGEGWVPAGSLREGDHVIRCLDAQRVARLLDPDHDHRPTAIEQVADALGPPSGGSFRDTSTTSKRRSTGTSRRTF